MNREEKIAFMNAQIAAATIAAQGMCAENAARLSQGKSLAYDEAAFQDVIIKYGIHHNLVISFFES